MHENLEAQFADDVRHSISICETKYNYNPTGFKGMIQRREAQGESVSSAAIDLIHNGDVTSGFTRIWEISQKTGNEEAYKLTVEWLISEPKYYSLFPAETVDLAKTRIQQYFGIER